MSRSKRAVLRLLVRHGRVTPGRMLRGKAKLFHNLIEELVRSMNADDAGMIPAGWSVTGFQKISDCSSLSINWQAETGSVSSCLTLQAGGSPLGTPVGSSTSHVHLANRQDLGGFFRWASVQVWQRVDTGPQSVIQTLVPGQLSRPQIVLDPLLVPPGSFVDPAPVPYSLIPLLDGVGLSAGSERSFSGQPSLERQLAGYARPSKLLEITVNSDGSIDKGPPTNGVHLDLPPGPGVKEKKSATARALGQAVGAFMDVTSEGKEILDILYESLPKYTKIKSGAGGNPFLRAKTLFLHADEIDLSKAIPDLIWNHYSDKVIGRAFGAVSKGSVRMAERGDETGFRLRQSASVQKTFGVN